MKKANRIIRKYTRKGEDVPVDEMTALGISEAQVNQIVAPDFAGRVGFPDYALQNNNANIRRYRQRLAEAETAANREDIEKEGDGYTFRLDTDENRVMFEFDGKPDKATRDILKGHGFKWSPARVAWVRKWTANGEGAGRAVKAILDKQ